jgi:hypothetical protein
MLASMMNVGKKDDHDSPQKKLFVEDPVDCSHNGNFHIRLQWIGTK